MSDHKFTYLKTALFAGVLMLLNTTTVLAATPACNTVLPANTTTTLDSDMDCPGRAINFGGGSDNAVLDCNGFTISNQSGRTINANSVTGITIKNCMISTDHRGGRAIEWTGVTNSEISSNSISTTRGGSRGISLRGDSNSNLITDNTVHTTFSVGLRIQAGSSNNIVTNNDFQADANYAVRILSGSGNELTGNIYNAPMGPVFQGLFDLQNGGMTVDSDGLIYAVENNFGSSAEIGTFTAFFKVDPITGAANSVIPLVDDVGNDIGIGFDALEILPNGRVLTFTGDDGFGNSSLTEIDPDTGEVSFLNPTSVPLSLTGSPNGLEAINDTLVMFTTNQGELGSFDLTTGVVTEIGEQAIGWTGLAIHPDTGTAYTVSRFKDEASGTAHLYTIDVTGTTATHIDDIQSGVISDIDFSPDGSTLYGNNGLVVIDIATGVGTFSGSFGGNPLEPASQNNSIEGNVWPTNPVQVSPANGATGLGASVTFAWKIVTNPDGGDLDYQFSLCEDFGFAGCAPTVVASVEKITDYASLEGLLPLVIFGTVLGSIGFRRRKWLLMVAVSLSIVVLVSNCGGGGGGGDAATVVDPATVVEHTEAGLKPATTYYWKVGVIDGIGTVESLTRSFTTQ